MSRSPLLVHALFPSHPREHRSKRDRMPKTQTTPHLPPHSLPPPLTYLMFLATTLLLFSLVLLLHLTSARDESEVTNQMIQNLLTNFEKDDYVTREWLLRAMESASLDQKILLLENAVSSETTVADMTPLHSKRRKLFNLSTNQTFDGRFPPMEDHHILSNKELLKRMFTHAYDGYMYNAFPSSELKPLSCSAGTFHLVRIPCLTLIDTLDTLLIMQNYTEFARSVERLREQNEIKEGLFRVDENVSVFETNIRVLGGLLSAHQLILTIQPEIKWDEVFLLDGSVKIGSQEEEEVLGSEYYWEYDGFLLELAVDIGNRLMPAFNTDTGIPYGTVNLIHGVPSNETTVASLAGGGTLTLEFELLTRLTGDPKYGNAAILATRALFLRRNHDTDLLGKHIDVRTGAWREVRSGIGSNSDSFYEYLLKFYILYHKEDFWIMFFKVYQGVYKYVRTDEHWFGDVEMHKTTSKSKKHVFESLAAFWPGLLVLLGELTPATKLLNAIFLAREELGFLPERLQYQNLRVDGSGMHSGGKYPLRPELLESCYMLHRATKQGRTSSWQWAADFSLHALEHLTKTECGYATVRKVTPSHGYPNSSSHEEYYDKDSIELEDEMPSYFLSETIKYLYLMFDEDNILHRDDKSWVFTTEAHPIHYEDDVRNSTKSEKWSKLTRSKIYLNQMQKFQLQLNETDKNDFHLHTLLTKDQLTFHPLGRESQISQSCPNYHHPSLGWVHALGLDVGLNYEEDYAEKLKSDDPPEGVCHLPDEEDNFEMESYYDNTIRLEMGPPVGTVEVMILSEGFHAKHVNSGETMEVSMVSMPNVPKMNYLMIISTVDKERRVVFADWENHVFVCEVELQQNEENVATFPCSPAMFGPTELQSLVQTEGIEVEGVISQPLKKNEKGCHILPSSDNTEIQMVHRGSCSFEDKSKNLKVSYNSKALIVINNEPENLFIMASSLLLAGQEEDEKEGLPLTVLVTKDDGNQIQKLSQNENVTGVVRVRPQDDDDEEDDDEEDDVEEEMDWPIVTTASDTVQILGLNGWGIHIVQHPSAKKRKSNKMGWSTEDGRLNWQMFVVQHDTKKEMMQQQKKEKRYEEEEEKEEE